MRHPSSIRFVLPVLAALIGTALSSAAFADSGFVSLTVYKGAG